MTAEKIKELISQMTLEEKASLVSGKNFWESQDIPRLGVPSIFLADGPHGLRKQELSADHLGLNESVKSTCFPTAATLSCSWDENLLQEIGTALGREARALDVGVLLGPGTNIKRNPRCGRNFEYFSEDPYLAGKYASAYIRGVQSQGVSACVKHFAVNSQERARMIVDEVVDERALREIYLTPFEMAVKQGKVKTVMSAYNKINGDYADENYHTLKEILRDEWGYNGVVVTDWGGNNDRVKALKCGNELEMPTTGGETDKDVVNAINNGELDQSVLDECVFRFLSLVYEVYENEKEEYSKEEHSKLAQKGAESSAVLLKNDGALPLNSQEKVCIIGDFAQKPRYQGGGSSAVNPTELQSVLDCAKDYPINFVGFEQGYDRYGKKKKGLIKKAVKLAQTADKILLFIGLDEITETEGIDRKDLSLPQNQLDLLTALSTLGKPIVAVLSCGAPITTDWDENVSALLHGYLAGQSGAKAMLNILTGKVNPSGKLAETYAFSYQDTPTYNYYLKKELTAEHRESIFIGYRYFEKAEIPVKYPFGYGLSYTEFEYSDIAVTDKGVSFTVKNTGKMDGAEVSELYIGANGSKVFRAKKELKGFAKTFLKVGESKKVFIPFDEYSFRFYNVKENKFAIEDLTYTICVGASSVDIRLSAEYKVTGETADGVYSETELKSYYSGNIKDVPDQEFEMLIGRKIPDGNLPFVKKNRIDVDYNTSVYHLKYAKGFAGRLFSWAIRFAYKFLKKIGKHKDANVILMGLYYMPTRGLSRLTGGMITIAQLDGLITMFNGKFFKGASQFFKAGKQAKKEKKQKAKQEKGA